jgi:DNA-directed RNA polymerase specialized sigma subunit
MMETQVETMEEFKRLTEDEANDLVLEHRGWAESIARSVARAWNMDWQLDGLDGAAMEALIFCSRRFQPARGVPFKGYARKRIHEASTEAARKSRGWKRGLSGGSKADQASREISAELFNVFPELREGQLPIAEEGGDDMRSAVRQLLVGASIIAAKQGMTEVLPDELIDYKRMVAKIAILEPVHQTILWKTYWEGLSMRTLATEWETDELNVIREHKVLLAFLLKSLSTNKGDQIPKVRPGLRDVAEKLKNNNDSGPFSRFASEA